MNEWIIIDRYVSGRNENPLDWPPPPLDPSYTSKQGLQIVRLRKAITIFLPKGIYDMEYQKAANI